MAKIPELHDYSTYGTKYTKEELKQHCKGGGFIDYDGFGRLCTNEKESDVNVYPSLITSKRKAFRFPSWATHVWWYNR